MMKTQSFVGGVMGLAIAATAATANLTQPATAQSVRTQFYCGTSQGVPTTIVRGSRGNLPVIRWTSTAFPPPYTPDERCRIVSQRFQAYHDNGTLNYITTGMMNRQPVVCIARRQGGDCTDLLFTLQPGITPTQARRTLERLLNYRALSQGGALNQTGERPYIDVEKYLNELPVEDETEVNPEPEPTPDGEAAPTPEGGSESNDSPWWN